MYSNTDIVIPSIQFNPLADIFYSQLVDGKFAFIQKRFFKNSFYISIDPFSENQIVFDTIDEVNQKINSIIYEKNKNAILENTLEYFKDGIFIAQNKNNEFTFVTKSFISKKTILYTDYYDLPYISKTKEGLVSSF